MERSRAVDVFAVDRFIALVERLIGLPWPIRLDQFESTAQQLGWVPEKPPHIFSGEFASGRQYITILDDGSKNINEIFFPFYWVKDVERGFELINDAFAAYVSAGNATWRRMSGIVVGEVSHVVWKPPRGATIDLMRGDNSINVTILFP